MLSAQSFITPAKALNVSEALMPNGKTHYSAENSAYLCLRAQLLLLPLPSPAD